MSIQNYLLPGIELAGMQCDQLKNSYVFNATMADHYEGMYRLQRRKHPWNFILHFFLWKKWKQYAQQAALIDLRIKFSSSPKNIAV